MARGRVGAPINVTGVIRRNLNPLTTPPPVGYRVISGYVWSHEVWRNWLRYVAARNTGAVVRAPLLGSPTASHIHITDEESLDGLQDPPHVARRLGLQSKEHLRCQRYGCVLIAFTISNPTAAILPPPNINARQQGLTVGDAREWLVSNIRLDTTMDVIYIGISPTGNPYWYDIPLTD